MDVTAPRDGEETPMRLLYEGRVTGIGGMADVTFHLPGHDSLSRNKMIPDHTSAVHWMFELLDEKKVYDLVGSAEAVGHRVVHGGERFSQSVLLDDSVLREIDSLSVLAPLHNPAGLAGIRGARTILGSAIPMVAVFDTAFHRSMPITAKTYALPYELAHRHHIQRYGFHGIAHASLLAGYGASTGRPIDQDRFITMQLGNGCSMAAIAGGRSVDTSMGFTPLEGLVMGTRCGDIDPSIVSYLADKEQVPVSKVDQWLSEQSGLLGLSGLSNDMRDILQAADQGQDKQAKLAIDVFCYRARKYVGAYLAALEGAEAVIFGGGIGEGSPQIRTRICAGMEWCGLRLDAERNASTVGLSPGMAACISNDQSPLKAYVVAADEETLIARETVRCLQQAKGLSWGQGGIP